MNKIMNIDVFSINQMKELITKEMVKNQMKGIKKWTSGNDRLHGF